MAQRYSIYEAKAHLSELLRNVKGGAEVTVTERGAPIAKVIPFPKKEALKERLIRLKNSSHLQPRYRQEFSFSYPPVPGGLQRFLKERE